MPIATVILAGVLAIVAKAPVQLALDIAQATTGIDYKIEINYSTADIYLGIAEMTIVDIIGESLIAAVLSSYAPVGCVVDCSTWHGTRTTENTIRVETWDGRIFRQFPEYPFDTDPSSPRLGYKLFCQTWGFEYEMIGEYRLFIRGTKSAPIRKFRVRSDAPDGWKPTYYFLWNEPPAIAPPPRSVSR